MDHTTTPRPHPPPLRPFVSENAYSGIVQQAIRHGWTHRDARQRNLGLFIAATVNHPLQVWGDTRPEWMHEIDGPRLQREMFPMWWDPDMAADKKPRVLVARFIPITTIRTLVFTKGMLPNQPNPPTGDSAVLAYFMEAWGQHSITPLYYPDNTRPVQYRQRRYVDVVW